MKSHGGKNDKALEVEVQNIQSQPANCTPRCEEIRLRAYEIYLGRGGFPGDELDDWLQAERELSCPVPQEGESPMQKRRDQ